MTREEMERFLETGTWSELGFYLYLKSFLRPGTAFSQSCIADRVGMTGAMVSLKISKMNRKRLIEVQTAGPKGSRLIGFTFEEKGHA